MLPLSFLSKFPCFPLYSAVIVLELDKNDLALLMKKLVMIKVIDSS